MDWTEAIALFHGTDWKHQRIGLERMRTLLSCLGDPQKGLRCIHIAGTNGKGSVSRMTQQLLTEAGYKTGLYISPHLERFNERISIDNVEISDSDLTRIARQIKAAVTVLSEQPTDFELITAAAFLWFSEQGCDFVVLEVGMGGRLDATNVIESPLACLILSIGLDHTEYLGDTPEKIAKEKAGILKPGSDLILYHQSASVEAVILGEFQKLNPEGAAVYRITAPDALTLHSRSLKGQCFSYKNYRKLMLSVPAPYQLSNAAVVLELVELLRSKGIAIPETALRNAFSRFSWPGRFELCQEHPTVLLDGAHNPDGVRTLLHSLTTLFPEKKFLFVIGVMQDKAYEEMLKLVSPLGKAFFLELPIENYARALPAEALARKLRQYFSGKVLSFPSVNAALTAALSDAVPEDVIVCFGSLYQVSAIRSFFQTPFGEASDQKGRSSSELKDASSSDSGSSANSVSS